MTTRSLTSIFFFCIAIFCCTSCKTDPKTPATETTVTISSRIRADPDKLNVALTTFGPSLQILRLINPTLLEFHPWSLELLPMLVKERPTVTTISEGENAGKTAFEYEMLDEAVWDDGSPVTGYDYVFSLKTLFNPHIPAAVYRGLLNFISDAEVDAQNPKKFKVIVKDSYIKAEYNTGGIFIIQKSFYDKEGNMDHISLKQLLDEESAKTLAETDEKLRAFADQMNDPKYSREPEFISGCGAYRLEEWVTGERVVLKKKENWWGDKLVDKYPLLTARPDVIVFRPLPDASTAINLIKDQSLDIASQLPNSQFLELKENALVNEHYNLYSPPTTIYSFLGLNMRSPKLNDKRVRRALAHLVDVDEIIKTVKQGMGEAITGPLPPMSKDYYKKLEPIKLNIPKAQALLKEAGWEDSNGNGIVDKKINGQLVEMNLGYLITPNNEVSNGIALIFKENAKKAGVNIDVIIKENSQLSQDMKKRDFEIFSRGAAPDLTLYDPYQYWHTESDNPGGSNFVGFGDAASDALIEQIRSTLDDDKRRELYHQFQQIIYDEQPVIFLYNAIDCVVMHKDLTHAEPSVKYPGVFENFYGRK